MFVTARKKKRGPPPRSSANFTVSNFTNISMGKSSLNGACLIFRGGPTENKLI